MATTKNRRVSVPLRLVREEPSPLSATGSTDIQPEAELVLADCVVTFDLGSDVLFVSYTRSGERFEEVRTAARFAEDQALADYMLVRVRRYGRASVVLS